LTPRPPVKNTFATGYVDENRGSASKRVHSLAVPAAMIVVGEVRPCGAVLP